MALKNKSENFKLAFVILAHEGASHVVELIDTLISDGDTVSLHYDARGSSNDFEMIQTRFAGNKNVVFANRVRCGWGDFSLVRATLNALEELQKSKFEFHYVYLVSGNDLPLKSIRSLKNFLQAQFKKRTEFIESVPFGKEKWVKGGLEKERFIYRHYFNERRHRHLFDFCWKSQQRLGISRKIPEGLQLALGSQWWCLTWDTCKAVLNYIHYNPRVYRFFKTTWIPDECFFQTIVRTVVPPERIQGHSLTFYHFSDYGKPYVFFDEHEAYLKSLNFFFGRKVALSAKNLRHRLHMTGRSKQISTAEPTHPGIAASELDVRRLPRRVPESTRRSIGVHYDGRFADMAFTGKHLLMYLTAADLFSHAEWRDSQPKDGFLVHGHLLNAKQIGFAGGRDVFGGYSKSQIDLLRESPGRAFANIMGSGPLVTAFSATWTEGLELAMAFRDLPCVSILVSDSTSLVAIATATLLQRNLDKAHHWQPSENEVLSAIADAVAGLSALRHFCDISQSYRNVRSARHAEELADPITRRDAGKALLLKKATKQLLERSNSAEVHLLGSSLSRSVSSTINGAANYPVGVRLAQALALRDAL